MSKLRANPQIISSEVGKAVRRKPLTGKVAKTENTSLVASARAKSKLRDIFEGAGFTHIDSDNIHFKIRNRQGEIDHIFIWENVILLCEETAGANDVAQHCAKKILFHGIISDYWEEFLQIYRPLNQALDVALGKKYQPAEFEVRHLYFSETQDVDEGVVNQSEPFLILSRANAAYFSSLVKTIARSAKYEILKYLKISLSSVGESRLAGGSVASHRFPGFILPASHTNYPKDFAVVSFYAEPMALIKRAYVLRRDGWEDANLSYQRFVRAEKLSAMREHLSENGKVFINNLIVTLPSTALITTLDGAFVDPKAPHGRSHINLNLPLELGTVGIVDGQHRIFAYFEGNGGVEEDIAQLRIRQNLLVTGIIFPPGYSTSMKMKFEAELFLSINNTQTGVETQLRQDLETIINPHTPVAIGRSIVNRLASEGPLKGMLHVSQFDPSENIATGSLGPYVLVSLLRKGSAFYKTWDISGSRDLTDATQRQQLEDYIVDELKKMFVGCSKNLPGLWRPVEKGGVLSTTVVGGLILLLERFAEAGVDFAKLDYMNTFSALQAFDFKSYRSSSWAKLSKELFAQLTVKIISSGSSSRKK